MFVGDDTTDEFVFAILPELNGIGFAVGSDGARHARDLRVARSRPLVARSRRDRHEILIMEDFGLDLAVLGNGQTAALIDPTGRIVWWCYPRFDGDPVFSRLLAGNDDKGFCDVVLDNMVHFASEYERNTAVVSTTLTDAQGASVKITDFAPRFRNFGRMFRPPQLMRIIEPMAGLPRITIRVRPTCDYGKPITDRSHGQQSHQLSLQRSRDQAHH